MKFKLLTIGATLAIVAAACSSAGSEPDQGVASLETGDMAPVTTVADQTDSTQSEEEVALAFAQCLRDEGIDVDDPTVDSSGNVRPPRTRDILNATDGLTLDEINSARDACMPLLDGVTFGFESIDPTEREDQLLEFAACMRENGYDLPDPDLTKTRGSGGGPFGGSIDLTDPAFQAAAAACDGIFGGFSGQPGTGSNG